MNAVTGNGLAGLDVVSTKLATVVSDIDSNWLAELIKSLVFKEIATLPIQIILLKQPHKPLLNHLVIWLSQPPQQLLVETCDHLHHVSTLELI